MSLSIDDLCASLSSSHVGQEAMDIAALQMQLAQTLFSQPIASSSQQKEDYAQPCNTPTGRTPSASFSWGPMVDPTWQSADHVPPRRNTDEHLRDEMEEDERMVEDLLIPGSPVSVSPKAPLSPGRSRSSTYSAGATEAAPSLFTTTDPFYIAQLQAAQNWGSAPPSVFSQSAFPSQPSPFFQRHNAVQNPLSLDAHTLLPMVAAAPSFDR